MFRVINRNPYLFGPGPLARRSALTNESPVKSLVVMASQGSVLALGLAFAWKFGWGDPELKQFEDYYKENPPR